MNAFPVNEAVLPVIVAVILIKLPVALRFGGIIAAVCRTLQRSGGGQQLRTVIEVKSNMTLEPDRTTGIHACGRVDGASASRCTSLNCSVNGRAIEVGAVSSRAKGANGEDAQVGEGFLTAALGFRGGSQDSRG